MHVLCFVYVIFSVKRVIVALILLFAIIFITNSVIID